MPAKPDVPGNQGGRAAGVGERAVEGLGHEPGSPPGGMVDGFVDVHILW